MRKLFAAALAICLVFAFAMPAAATDLKVSGDFNVQGFAWDKANVMKDNGTNQAWYTQRLRFKFTLEPEEGVGVHAQGDVYDNHIWDNTDATKNMFAFDYAYGWFTTGFGKFTIGRQAGGQWGLTWGDGWHKADRIKYESAFGPLGVVAVIEKQEESDQGTTEADDDKDYYALGANFKWDGGEAGALVGYTNDATLADTASYKGKYYSFVPYVKATMGPVYLEAEFTKLFGDERIYEDGLTTADVSKTGMNFLADAKVNLGPAYVSAFFGFIQGDDQSTANENESGFTGDDWDFGLILFNDEDWSNTITTHGSAINPDGGLNIGLDGPTSDAGGKYYGIRAGVSPIEKLSLTAALITGSADEKPATYANDDFGVELDLGASYKLFSSVTYTIQFGYLWTGDFWKGTSAANQVDDIYLIHNKLNWVF